MSQRSIPFLFFRGGTSRGPFFQKKHLPKDRATLEAVLLSVMGAGHLLNIDGLGGSASVTTKVAILSPATDDWADVNYLFAQVQTEEKLVDFRPTCGNILSAVGPAALEMGLVKAQDDTTKVNILSVNTGAKTSAMIQTPNHHVTYAGNTAISGVAGTAAPITLNFVDVAGSVTEALLPTGHSKDEIDGIAVTCMDVAMPVVIAQAKDFGLSGYESSQELNANRTFLEHIEKIRIQAGELMGLGNVRESVVPKFAIIAPPKSGGAICARYFIPWACHPSMSVTGGQCIASCILAPNTTASDLMQSHSFQSPASIHIEHPSGILETLIDYQFSGGELEVYSGGIMRTARKIAAGELFVPNSIWT